MVKTPEVSKKPFEFEIGGRVVELTEEQQFIYSRFSRLVGTVLSFCEMAVPEGPQMRALRRNVNEVIYGARNDFLAKTGYVVKEERKNVSSDS